MVQRLPHILSAASVLAISPRAALRAQNAQRVPAISVTGQGPATFVLLSGLVGGVAGFRKLEARLVERHYRVVAIDPYSLSLDSADVTFAAHARRVERVLDSLGVVSALVVGHAHGAGVALRLAANAPHRVRALYFLDVGALPDHRSPVFSGALRLVPIITRLPGGEGFIRRRFIRGLRDASGPNAWLDNATERAYTDPLLGQIDRVIGMALRLRSADEPEPLPAIVGRVRVPVTVLLGDAPHSAGVVSGELEALEPLGSLLSVAHLAGVGHFPHEEDPDGLVRLLLAARTGILAAARVGER
jgi:pimeloyl-ACP methyl ester carboxylesterase